jgi:hypothetical protein
MFIPIDDEGIFEDDETIELEEFDPEATNIDAEFTEFKNNYKEHITGIAELILKDMGFFASENYYTFDFNSFIRLVVDFGLNVSRPGVESLLPVLSGIYSFGFNQKDKTVWGMKKLKDKSWKNSSNEIRVVNHNDNELFCPMCKSIFSDTKSILFHQTVSVAPTVYSFGEECIKNMRQHIVLTPICPKCYCDNREMIANNGIKIIENYSHVSAGPIKEHRIVPLLPRCMESKIDSEQSNAAVNIPGIYWPKTMIDILCSKFISKEK